MYHDSRQKISGMKLLDNEPAVIRRRIISLIMTIILYVYLEKMLTDVERMCIGTNHLLTSTSSDRS